MQIFKNYLLLTYTKINFLENNPSGTIRKSIFFFHLRLLKQVAAGREQAFIRKRPTPLELLWAALCDANDLPSRRREHMVFGRLNARSEAARTFAKRSRRVLFTFFLDETFD